MAIAFYDSTECDRPPNIGFFYDIDVVQKTAVLLRRAFSVLLQAFTNAIAR
ncbi:MAG: hypothetical protein V7K57_08455 [Nostoc sp.]|uniref:hypothetical protein n=1 Tax=Nostoc sp. TaxID=1180 RepID=UPI002FFB4237